MRVLAGDIWSLTLDGKSSVLVIPTNVGWKSDDSNVMGAGLAKQAAEIDPSFPGCYGRWCQEYGDRIYLHVPTLEGHKFSNVWFCAAPSKPLDLVRPHLSWKGQATLAQVEKSVGQLRIEASIRRCLRWYIPLIGAGNGGLSAKDVRKIIEETSWTDNVTLVLPG